MSAEPVLMSKALRVGYGHVQVIPSLDLEVRAGEVVSLVGPNGAGKTTTLLALAGILPPMAGQVLWHGVPVNSAVQRRVRRGLGFVTEERAVFSRLTVAENMRVARVSRSDVLELFPELSTKTRTRAGQLSGGEQQMLALGLALAAKPALLLIDELSMGLAPQIVSRLLGAIRDAADAGCGVLLVEQQAVRAIQASDRVYVMQRGEIQMSGAAAEFDRLDLVKESYFVGGPRPEPV